MRLLKRRHGVDKVHVRIAFARGLYPFHPPSVEVRAPNPRLYHSTRCALMDRDTHTPVRMQWPWT